MAGYDSERRREVQLLPKDEIERRKNRRRAILTDREIFRTATRDISPEQLAVNQEWWDARMAKPLFINDDGIDPDRYEVAEGAEIIGDIVLDMEEF